MAFKSTQICFVLLHKLYESHDNPINVAFHGNTLEPYFNAKKLCEMLNFKKCTSTINKYVPNEYVKRLDELDENYEILYENEKNDTLFVSEHAISILLLNSNNPTAKNVINWITGEVLPSIIKYGEYELPEDLKIMYESFNRVLHNMLVHLRRRLKYYPYAVKNNMSTRKYPDGESIYLTRSVESSEDVYYIELDKNEVIDIKIETTHNPNKHFSENDATASNTQLLKIIKVRNAKNIKECVLNVMEQKLSRTKKNYVHCSYDDIMNHIARCIEVYENRKIDIEPDVDVLISEPTEHNKRNISSGKMLPAKQIISGRNKNYRNKSRSEKVKNDNVILQGGSNSTEIKYLGIKEHYLKLCSSTKKRYDYAKIIDYDNRRHTPK